MQALKQILKKEREMNKQEMDKRVDDLIEHLKKPRDLSNASLEDKAGILTLHFIGYVAKPIGVSDAVYKKALEAFNNNRGKVEWEEAAVLKALQEEIK